MKQKILIVEDNPDLISILQLQLKIQGYETILAENGKQAVEMAFTLEPDLIVMDSIMPEMDGLQATRLIRQNPKTSSIPIIAVTARVSRINEKRCFQSGCDDHIAKPFLAEDLVPCIEKLLKQDSR